MNNSVDGRPKILVICDYYLPGFKSGGGMRTIVNTVERLSDEFEFFIVTRDHDGKGDREPYSDIEYGTWQRRGYGHVFYLRPNEVSVGTLRGLFEEVSPSLVYLNSFFSTLTFHTLRLRKQCGDSFPGLLLAPCGELSPGAMSSKRLKKLAYTVATRFARLYSGIRFKASCEEELHEIHKAVGRDVRATVAPDLPATAISTELEKRPTKERGFARLVFVSRINPKKNLLFLLRMLADMKGRLTLDIFGDADDMKYSEACFEAASSMPNVSFKGPLRHELVAPTLAGYDFFVLPTRGENFGHVILESLSTGCPVLISDTTPWNRTQTEGAGLVIPLDEVAWRQALNAATEMSGEEHRSMRERAVSFADSFLSDPSIEIKTRELLRSAIRDTEEVQR